MTRSWPYTVGLTSASLNGYSSRQSDEKPARLHRSSLEDLRVAALPDLAARDPHELVKLHEVRNMIQVAEIFLHASLARTESRGSHFRVEHPEPDNERWLSWINLRKGEGGKMRVETEPVPLESYPIQPHPTGTSR